MKRIIKLKIYAICLGIIIALSIVLNLNLGKYQLNAGNDFQNRERLILKEAEYWNLTGTLIDIDDSDPSKNWSYTATNYDWCTGSGTWDDPYIIENVIIDGLGSGICISIKNSKKYFIIKNCTTYNSGLVSNSAGIFLEHVNNGTLINNNCSNIVIEPYIIAGTGIFLSYYCDNNTLLGNIAENNFYGIGIVQNCNNNTIIGNILNHNLEGIYLESNCNLNTITGNIVNNNNKGIFIYLNCDENTIFGNTINNNQYGIYLDLECDNNTLSGNIVNDNEYGIYLDTCEDNIVSGNYVNNNSVGIYLRTAIHNNISENAAEDNQYGIYLRRANHNNISENAAEDNQYGIYLNLECDNNTLSGNIVNDNEYGIYFYSECNNNIILGNNINNNGFGIYLRDSYIAELSGNTLKKCGIMVEGSLTQLSSHLIYTNNTVNGRSLYYYVNKNGLDAANFTQAGQVLLFYCNNSVVSNLNVSSASIGIYLDHCYNNTILNNTANNNIKYGIFLKENCTNNIISGNFVNDNEFGIYLDRNCEDNIISGNTANNNTKYGIYFNEDCTNNTISENFIYFNSNGGIYISSVECYDNLIKGNILVSKDEKFINDNGINTVIISNHYLSTSPSFFIEILNQSISNMRFTIKFCISSQIIEWGFELWDPFIQIWWNGIILPSENITELGNGLFNISLSPIFVTPSEDPILLNMTISEAHHLDKYFETYIAVHPNDLIEDTINMEIVDQMFSAEEFNITFFVYNTTSADIDFATFQMWWNGIDVSADVQNLGSGLYFISLEPIIIVLGENPILLNMTISASGYEDKYFEMYIAVHPGDVVEDTLELEIVDQSFSIEEFNMTFFIHNTTGAEIDFATFQIWWNGIDVSTDILNLGNGLYFISLEPITVAPGEDPILLNMTISAPGYADKYFEKYITVRPSDVVEDILELEIVDQSFSTEQFNITFFIHDTTDAGINFATFQILWNDIDVSADVQNLGNGYYFISLESITVNPGENPILLSITIFATGYEEKYFETYIAVDPASLLKGEGEPTEEFPLTLIIIISTVSAGIVIGVISIYWLRKRKLEPQ